MKKYLTILFWILSISINAQVVLTIEGQAYTNSDSDWNGVTVSKAVPTTLTFRNNTITSENVSGYVFHLGEDTNTSEDNNVDGALS